MALTLDMCKLGLVHTCSGAASTALLCVQPRIIINYIYRLLEPCRHCSHLLEHQRPWILWLQGGPGASGVGYGNMAEIGPYTPPYWLPRSKSWADLADLVFVDNPVGTGFSYVTNSSLYGALDYAFGDADAYNTAQSRPTRKSPTT